MEAKDELVQELWKRVRSVEEEHTRLTQLMHEANQVRGVISREVTSTGVGVFVVVKTRIPINKVASFTHLLISYHSGSLLW